MPASTPGDPRALQCRHCGAPRRYVRGVLVCGTCDATSSWPGTTPEPGRSST
ncbi:MAG: hypothetical protein AVDCRST_MAG35-1745 [uncultured Quadrisphaera sp.]|uniref:Uncharacterized protein n=1 Tax=uncultured Quadrisphaera sp. TaxID=904978 RepID=A0A6J4PQJ5_9ACTN|nr:MAG: hypothetical protein AVDCRST_MAG35-1745 [uncultured Quadrisphaera sp.]